MASLSPELQADVMDLLKRGFTHRQISEKLNVARSSVSKYRNRTPVVIADKKTGTFSWEEWTSWIEDGQRLRNKASSSQNFAKIQLGDGTRPVILAQIADLHMGSWAADYGALRTLTEEIKATPDLYIVLGGDLIEMAVKMRSVLEVTGQILPPEKQLQFLESWLDQVLPKVAFSCWCNHGVEREEKLTGISSVKNLLAGKTVYFNGIGHPDVSVGKETYNISVSHKYRGNSMYDSTFGPKRYMRMEANDREISLQHDLHRPGISLYWEGGKRRLAMTCGTLQLNSGFAQRYFSLFTQPVFPCVVLHPDRHEFVPFWNLQAARQYIGG